MDQCNMIRIRLDPLVMSRRISILNYSKFFNFFLLLLKENLYFHGERERTSKVPIPSPSDCPLHRDSFFVVSLPVCHLFIAVLYRYCHYLLSISNVVARTRGGDAIRCTYMCPTKGMGKRRVVTCRALPAGVSAFSVSKIQLFRYFLRRAMMAFCFISNRLLCCIVFCVVGRTFSLLSGGEEDERDRLPH